MQQQRYSKTGTNSAYKRMVQQRQDNRRFVIIGVAVGLCVLAAVAFGGNDNASDVTPETGITASKGYSEHPLVRYGRGVRSIEEIDEQIESSSGN